MTQIESIRKTIATLERGELFTTDEIRDETGFPKPSIRRTLSNLVKTGEITRIEQGLFRRNNILRLEGQVDERHHRKFIGTNKYRGNPRQFFAVTYEKNDIDRESELLATLGDYLNERYVQSTGNTGYSDDIVERREVQFNFEYPRIQVGEL